MDTGPGAPGRAKAGAPGTARTASLGGQEGKDARVAALTRRSQDSRAASNGTRAQPPASQDPRTARGRQDQDETPPTAGTGPAEPRGAAAATAGTSVPESRAEVPDAGAGLAGRRAEGAATAVAVAGQSARATRCPACSQSPATQQRPRLQAADFKSEPRWDFEEKYSFDTGGLQTVSVPAAPALCLGALKPLLARPPAPTRSLTPQAPLLALAPPCPILLSYSGRSRGGEGRSQNPSPGSTGRCEREGDCAGPPRMSTSHQSG